MRAKLCAAVYDFGLETPWYSIDMDVGSGKGRALLRIKGKMPNCKAIGIEPSPELRSVGHAKGLSDTQLIDGDANESCI